LEYSFLLAALATAIRAGTPLLYAALGAILHERAGVLNLGLEGLMLVGAVSGFLAAVQTHSLMTAILVVMVAGGVMGILLALLVVGLRVNQVVAGLALTVFGTGLSAYLGKAVIGVPSPVSFKPFGINVLQRIPFFGPVLFQHDILVYGSYLIVPILWWILFHTRLGLSLRAVGEEPAAADAMGVDVTHLRYTATIVGGMLTALGGAYLSLAYTPTWIENMVAGRGWISLALVVFSGWNPVLAALGAYLFGGVDSLGFRLQASGYTTVPSFFLRMMPYVLTVVLLIVVTPSKISGIPRALGVPYRREQR
jgi:simple sugar transport system permease protein